MIVSWLLWLGHTHEYVILPLHLMFDLSSLVANGDEPAGVGAAGAAGLRWTQQTRTQARVADQGASSAEGRLQPRCAHEDQRALPTTLPRQNALPLRAGHAWPSPPCHSRYGGRRRRCVASRPDATGVWGSRWARWRPFACRVATPLAARPREARVDWADAPSVSLGLAAPGPPRRQAATAALLRHAGRAHQADKSRWAQG